MLTITSMQEEEVTGRKPHIRRAEPTRLALSSTLIRIENKSQPDIKRKTSGLEKASAGLSKLWFTRQIQPTPAFAWPAS